ncbi:3-oxoacyl-[acyl-carrier-protein] synthase III C-terminal domain-containing protein [Streptomyces sp. NPDC049967]|uniref:type III polyketide synthase n=1 Tax=unclassified Streptomyces TaxID=2593676 RepID=UPI002E1343D3|nr:MULTISPECIES: 3-oxoacyl-[acyl-carrier-protein] synthase III C-terminal domain-containing protein [unclassified Streptomyces]WSJ20698.1 type III polyketide synthase [Streptomyces sp. NBC_01324]
MTRIAAVHGTPAPYRHTQREVTDMVARTCLPPGADRRVLDRLHENARVRTRNMVLPLERYAELDGFGDANDVFIGAAVDMGADALRGALRTAGLRPGDVDLLMFTSVTGVAAPSVDARLVGRLGLRPDVKRLPVFGLGCVAGAAGVARLHDYLLGHPDDVAVLLSVELCSLTFQRHDASTANLVATALFGDGAAAVVALGAGRASGTGPQVVATRSRMYPDTEHVMGWDIRSSGFKVLLDPAVPDVVRRYLADDVGDFLAEHGLKPKDVAHWVCHPGGPKVLEAVSEVLSLPDGALDVTWRSLAEVGNLSSSSVLHVLRDTLEQRRPEPGSPGLLLAMGPGFCCELVLLRW